MDAIIIKAIEGFPTFAGLIICIAVQATYLNKAFALLERLCKPCQKDEEV
jgi:hypothetical protein